MPVTIDVDKGLATITITEIDASCDSDPTLTKSVKENRIIGCAIECLGKALEASAYPDAALADRKAAMSKAADDFDAFVKAERPSSNVS